MKSKTLIAAAVASTIGWSAAAFAGTSHEVLTPYSPNESGDNLLAMLAHQQSFGALSDRTGTSTGESGGGVVMGGGFHESLAHSSELSAIDESLAASDAGIFSDYYVVSWTPAAAEGWDFYVIDDAATDNVILVETFDILIPTHELALVPIADDAMAYELTLVPLAYDMHAERSAELEDRLGE